MAHYAAAKDVIDELLEIHGRVHLVMENLLLRKYDEAERIIRYVDLQMAKLIHDTEMSTSTSHDDG